MSLPTAAPPFEAGWAGVAGAPKEKGFGAAESAVEAAGLPKEKPPVEGVPVEPLVVAGLKLNPPVEAAADGVAPLVPPLVCPKLKPVVVGAGLAGTLPPAEELAADPNVNPPVLGG
jgi:hypothetical protein